jgi:chromosome segregation ATPase
MSYITEAKTYIKKIQSLIDSINGLNNDSIPKLKEFPDKLLKLIEVLEEEKNSKLKTIDSNMDEINTLKNTISQNIRDISKLEDEINELNNERQTFLDKNQAAQNELAETKENISAKKGEYERRSQRIEELETKIGEMTKIQDEFEEKLKEIENELQETYIKKEKFVNSFEKRVEAMKLLISKEYIHSSQFQIIQTLQKDTTLELKKISAALDIKEEQIKKILHKMVEANGPIEYDEDAGTIILKEEVGF